MDNHGGLGRAIREAREKAGMTLRQLAEKVGVSAPFQCDLEHERRGTVRLAAYAEALGVTEASLLARSNKITRADTEWINANPELLKLIRRHREDKLRRGRKVQ